MVDLGNEGGDAPLAEDGQNLPPAAADALVAPAVAPVAPINPGAPLTAADILSMFADLKTSMLKEVRSSVKEEIDARLKPSTSASNSFDPNAVHDADDSREPLASPARTQVPKYNAVEPFYSPQPLQHPRINPVGPPPPLKANAFAKWKLDMESHIRSASTQLWWIVVNGFNPKDPMNLTPREAVDDQLNATAHNMLRTAVTDDYSDSIALLKTAKEIWDCLEEALEGDEAIRRSRLALLKQEVNLFVRNEGESAEEVYRRLKSLVLNLRTFGCTWANDDFIKDKFIDAMVLTEHTMVMMIHQRPDYQKLTAAQVVSTFSTHVLLETKSKKTFAIAQATKNSNLALKAKKVVAQPSRDEEVVEETCEEDVDTSCPANDFAEDLALLVKKYSGTMANKGKNLQGRSFGRRKCYNCDSPRHFVHDCPYERREDKSEKLVLKKKKFTKFSKRKDDKALVHEEYMSGDEDDGDDDHVGTAAIAMHATTSSSTTGLFDSPNEDKPFTHHCLMAKEVKTKSKSLKPFIHTPNVSCEIVEDECDDGVDNDEESLMAFMKTLHGEARARFSDLLKSLAERDDFIENVENLLIEEKERVELLEHELHEESVMRASLEEALSSHKIDFVKTDDALQLALENKDALKVRVEKLLVDHTRLVEEHELLVTSSKVVKGDLIALTESYAQLKATTIKALTSVPHIDLNDESCTANFAHDCTSLQEENKKLKAQIEKGLVSCIQGEKNLNDLLSNQKECVAKEGIGFDPSSKKKKTKKKSHKKKIGPTPPPQQKIAFVHEGHKEKEKEKGNVGDGKVTRDKAIPKEFAGKNNPSYVLMRGDDGYTFAKFVGTNYDDYAWTIWVPKTLVANSLGPIAKWGPKIKA